MLGGNHLSIRHHGYWTSMMHTHSRVRPRTPSEERKEEKQTGKEESKEMSEKKEKKERKNNNNNKGRERRGEDSGPYDSGQ